MHRHPRSIVACSAIALFGPAIPSPAQTPSELCAGAPMVAPGTFQYTGAGANNDGSSTCGEGLNITDRWVRYRPIEGGPASVTLSGSGICTRLVSVHSDCPASAANTVACNVALAPAAAVVNFTATANTTYLIRLASVPVCSGPWSVAISGPATGKSFTYQGRLKQSGSVVSGPADLSFSLWSQEAGGSPIGSPEALLAVPVSEGLFTVVLNGFDQFGPDAFDGSPRWLEIAARVPAGTGPYTTLSPRQKLTPGGLAWFSNRAAEADRADRAAEADRAATAFTLSAPGGPSNVVVVDGSGNVGIGTSAPTERLDIRRPTGEFSVLIGQTGSSASVDVVDDDASLRAGAYVDHDGAGVIYADIKNFRVPNPLNPVTDIVYACPEGPEAAMYVRGTASLRGGHAVITLPDHFRLLAAEAGITVQLTPDSPDSMGLAVTHKSVDRFEVAELHGGQGNYEFDWLVYAVRREHQDYQVIRNWNERVSPGTEQEVWARRLADIQRRQERVHTVEAAMAGRR